MGTVVDAGRAKSEAMSMAEEIARRAPLAIRAAKMAIDEGLRQVSVFFFYGKYRNILFFYLALPSLFGRGVLVPLLFYGWLPLIFLCVFSFLIFALVAIHRTEVAGI